MTLQEAKDKFEGKTCDIHWAPLDRKARENEAMMRNTLNVRVKRVYENCHGVVLFECEDTITTPFPVQRLLNPR